jgi:hypothetical protein
MVATLTTLREYRASIQTAKEQPYVYAYRVKLSLLSARAMLGSLIVGVTEAVWTVEESVKVREALPFIIVPVVFIVAALYWPEVPLVERLTLIAVSGLILFVMVASIRSDLRKPRPPVTVDSGASAR